jgi:protein-S-isoprenylcysteine O-methyltransferase Ste14
METFHDSRHWIGVVVLVTWAPAILAWVLIHPVVTFWRRTGPFLMWVAVLGFMFASGYSLYFLRESLLGPDLGFTYLALVPGVLLVGLGFTLDFERRKTLTQRILLGVPELQNDASNLLTTGPYARVRHPRYLAIQLSYLGFALIANYLGLYGYMLAGLGALFLIIHLEEKELRKRFGKAYDDYAAKTPMLIPNLTR